MLIQNYNDLNEVRIGFPAGTMQIGIKMVKIQNCFQYREALVFRTARRLMDGHVYVPEKCFE